MNILTIVILAIFLLFAWSGFQKGMVRKLAGIVSLALSVILVSVALPYIADFLKSETPIYELLVDRCEEVIGSQTAASLLGSDEDTGIDREQIKSLMNQYGMDSSAVDAMSDEQLKELAGQYFQEYLDQSEGQESGGISSLSKIRADKADTESADSFLPKRNDDQL